MAIFMEEEMQDLEIIIKLDPIHDGIKDFFNVGKIEDRRGLLISTTGKYRTIWRSTVWSVRWRETTRVFWP